MLMDALLVGDQAVPAPAMVVTVAVLAAVQSVFGVGLLVFGTPTLLLLGVPFELVLAYLLPCSLTVSALQVASSGGLRLEPIRRLFLSYSAPAVLVATAVTLVVGSPGGMRAVVGGMLLATAVIRLIAPVQHVFAGFVRGHLRPLLVLLGLVHGASNLGGGLLTLIVGTTFADKTQIRRSIAFCYGLMASIQLVVVFAASSPAVVPALWLTLPLTAATVYLVVGRRLFSRAGEQVYQWSVTGLVAGFGVLMLAGP